MKTYFSSPINNEKSNSIIGFDVPLRFFATLIFLFQFSFFFAQDYTVDNSDTLFVSSGVRIYSADKTFNKQIAQKKIIISDKSTLIHDPTDKNILVITSKNEANKKGADFVNQIKLAKLEKQQKLLKKVHKYLANFEKSQEKSIKYTLTDLNSTRYFFKNTSSTKVYLHQRTNQYEIGKKHEVDHYYLNLALEYLHTEKYFYYKNKPLDFCFSEVHSVRPPPVLFCI